MNIKCPTCGGRGYPPAKGSNEWHCIGCDNTFVPMPEIPETDEQVMTCLDNFKIQDVAKGSEIYRAYRAEGYTVERAWVTMLYKLVDLTVPESVEKL